MTDEPRDFGSRHGEEAEAALLLMQIWGDGEAEVVRRLLDTYGIPCQVVSQITHSIFPLSVDGLGEVRIYVPASRLDEAKALVAEHRRQGMEMVAPSAPAPSDSDSDPHEKATDEQAGSEG